MITIDPDKPKILEFKIDISGNSTEPVARLMIPLGENLNLFISGQINNKSIQVEIPKLRPFYEILKSGAAQLEVLVDGNVFTPWFDQIEYQEKIKVVAEAVIEKDLTDKQNFVKVGASLVNENSAHDKSLPIKKEVKHKFDFKNDDYL